MRKSVKKKASLKRRITRTFSLLNIFSLLILLTVVALAVGFSFNTFTQRLSSSVAERMASALSLNQDMNLKQLGAPYLISTDKAILNGEGEVSLIYYRVFEKGQITFDSLNKTESERQAYKSLKERMFMQYINVKSNYDFTDQYENKRGTIEVEMNPLLVYIAYWMLIC